MINKRRLRLLILKEMKMKSYKLFRNKENKGNKEY